MAQAYGQAEWQDALSEPAQPVWALQTLKPGDRLVTGRKSKIVLVFLHDLHREVVDPETSAQVAYQGLLRSSQAGSVRRLARAAALPAPVDVRLPDILAATMAPDNVSPDPAALDHETVYLGAWVDSRTYPPTFHSPFMGVDRYRFQLFDDQGRFLEEQASPRASFRWPASSRLTKGVQYGWQVLAPDGTVLVPRYPFQVLTRVQTRQLAAAENADDLFEAERLLVYDWLGMSDAMLHQLTGMLADQPENPLVRRALACLYQSRGCPAHARAVLADR